MNMPIYIELLARNGSVLERQRFLETPIRIGRAYDNDLIIDDPFVAPHHAMLEGQQELLLSSVETRNGIVINKRCVAQAEIQPHTEIRLGHTRLRVRRADHPVADELPDMTNHRWEGLMPALTGLSIATIVAAAEEWLDGNSASETISMVSEVLSSLLLVIGWVALWSLANRLLAGHARFGRHLFIASLGLLFSILFMQLSGALAYWLAWPALDRYNDFYLLAPLALTIYFHLVTISPRLSRRMAAITATAYLCLVGMLLSSNYTHYGTLADKAYMAAPYPPGLRPAQLASIDSFLQGTAGSQERLEEKRRNAGD